MTTLQFAINSYQSRALRASAQRCVNFFAEALPKDAESHVVVYNAPGTKSFASGLAGQIRGMIVMNGILYVVAGLTFYSIASDGTATLIGTINVSGTRVSMAINRATTQQLCFVDGTDGWTYDTSNGLVQITDGDFVAADTVAFQDQYFIFNQAGTSNFFISNLNDGTAFTATDFANAEGSPDDVVAVFSDHRELWVFGEETTEVYYNSGNTDFPFERIDGAFIERGCAAAQSIAAEDNTLFWLGDDLVVYRAAGYTPQRISTHAIEEDIRTFSSTADAYAFFVNISGHKFYHLIFPTGKKAYVYDVATGLWHERESYGQNFWRGSAYVKAYGKHLIGDAFQGRIGELDMDTFTEYSGTMQGSMTSGPLYFDGKRAFHKRLELHIESGVGTTTGGTPQLWMDYSDDGGRTWSARKPVRSMGAIGEYTQRLRWLQLGASRERVYRVTVADAVKRSVIAANIDVLPGAH